jgi:prevent-host-death family protein
MAILTSTGDQMPARKRSPKLPAVKESATHRYSIRPELIEIGAGAFKDQCLQLLEQVRVGNTEILVTKHGVPVARVVAPRVRAVTSRGFMSGTILEQGDIVSPDPQAWGDLGK